MARPLMRVALYNCGQPLGWIYAAACQALRRAELVGVTDDDPNAAQACANGVGAPVYRSLQELIAKAKPAAIVIAGPTLHAIPRAILRHRVHLLHAWPWGSRMDWTRSLEASAARVDKVLSFAFPYRGLFKALGTQMGAGPLGPLRRVSWRVGGAGPDVGSEPALSEWGGLADPLALFDGAWALLGFPPTRRSSARLLKDWGGATIDFDADRLEVEWLRVPDEPHSTVELHCDHGVARLSLTAWWAEEPGVAAALNIRGRDEEFRVAVPSARSNVEAILEAFVDRCDRGIPDRDAIAHALELWWLVSALPWSASRYGLDALRRGRSRGAG